MSDTMAKIVIFVIPLCLSLGWFSFWVIRIRRLQKRKRSAGNGR